MKKVFTSIWVIAVGLLLLSSVYGQESEIYRLPPTDIQKIVSAKQLPAIKVDAEGKRMILAEYQTISTIATLAEPELTLAGIQINPANNGQSREVRILKLSIKSLKHGREVDINSLPDSVYLTNITWSPDNTKIAFCVHYRNKIALWYAEVQTGVARPVKGIKINGLFDKPYEWLSDSKRMLCRTISRLKNEPIAVIEETKPVIQQNDGSIKASRTYQGMLKNAYDEELFDYYATSQVIITNLEGEAEKIGVPGVISSSSASPDGAYVLVETIHKPYSYTERYYRFPRKVDVYTATGSYLKTLVDVPLLDEIPPLKDAASPVARGHDWQANAPATLYWVEAQDGGNPDQKATIRDKIYTLKAPFTENAALIHNCSLRFRSLIWGDNSIAVVHERWWSNQKQISYLINTGKRASSVKLFEYSLTDRYNAPGEFYTCTNSYGKEALMTNTPGDKLYLLGEGASPEGDQPFVDVLHLRSQKITRLWQSQKPYYEKPIAILSADKKTLLTRRESVAQNPNYALHDLVNNSIKQLTFFEHPYPALKSIARKEYRFTREDGVELSAYIFLSDKADRPLPTFIWSYPTDYKSAEEAAQIVGSPYMFSYLPPFSPVALATQGYAVMIPMMPVIGEGQSYPNDTYITQLMMNVKAAISEGARLGMIDTMRLAVGGHSYGAIMAANLATHTHLFRAGIAMSGAYNRTLTPFGFQSEERTYWQSPEVYDEMSPFQHADKMHTPLLLIHGEADNNPGTFPLQSERYYQALKGLGATVRFVSLPHEDHFYEAEESISHIYWEILNWLDKHLKNAL